MRPTILTLALLLMVLPACGGSGGGETLSAVETQTDIPTDEPRSGSILNDRGSHSVLGSATESIVAGSASQSTPPPLSIRRNAEVRGFYVFPLSSIPAGATIVRATIRTTQIAVLGAPFTKLGSSVLVDHIDLGTALDSADFASVPLAGVIGSLSSDPSLGARSLDVTSAVQTDMAAGRPRSSFRVYFPTWDVVPVVDDLVGFTNEADTAGSGAPAPFLEVIWR